MNLLTDHIEYLLHHHDCVVVPGFGAFIAQYQSARFDEGSGLMLPPCRCLAFNGSITHNDGLLASSVSRRLGISYDSAVSMIADESVQLRKKIYEEGKVAFGSIGAFKSVSTDGDVEFIPDTVAGINAEMFYLQAFETVKLADRKLATFVNENQYKTLAKGRSRFAEFMKVAAALAVIIALALSLINILPLKASEEISYASLSPAHNVSLSHKSETAIIEEQISLPILALPEGVGTAEYSHIPRATTESYYIIVASFPTVDQALRYISESGDSSLHVLECPSRIRVHAGSASTLQEAIAKSRHSDIADRYKDVWIHRQ